jgi:hypothetical protein
LLGEKSDRKINRYQLENAERNKKCTAIHTDYRLLSIACAAMKKKINNIAVQQAIKGFVRRTNIRYMLYVRKTRNLSVMDLMASGNDALNTSELRTS